MSTGRDEGVSGGHRPRGTPAVFLVAGPGAGLHESLLSVLTHTPADVPMVLVDPGAVAAVSLASVQEVNPGRQVDVRSDPDAADPAALAASVAPADVVLIDLPCRVAAGWLEGLRAAAHSGAEVASAVAMTTAAVPEARGTNFPKAAAGAQAAGSPWYPRAEQFSGPCRYIRRSAIDLAGPPRLGFGGRCLEAGLAHVVADQVLVDAEGRDEVQVSAGRALGVARRAVSGLSVVVDARTLDGPMDGTRVHVLELIAALARSGRPRVTALVPARLTDETRAALELAPGVTLISLNPGQPPPLGLHADVAHRPFQISAHADLTVLGQLADRLVVTHQDLISYHNPAYFPSAEAWVGYRAMTARALRAADRVLFFSAHVRDDALGEELVEAHRASVVPLGVDHTVSAGTSVAAPAPPPAAQALRADSDAAVILCLGADFHHKNRVFALRMVQALQQRHDWRGRLVLAGPRVAWGSSREQEGALQADDGRLAAAVTELDAVTESEKQWLLERASLVIYPTVHEGFGLVPFEAAAHDRPCLWAAGTALSEFLPDAAAAIVPWDAGMSAEAALTLMRDPERARANIDAVAVAAGRLHWDETAARLIAVYHSVCDAPRSPAAQLERDQGLMREGLSDDAIRLVGPGGALPRELERPLLALATHRRISGPIWGAIRAAYRASLRWPGRKRTPD
ncbi:MAG: glycosyltransferase [Solirubrobacteraceae bacterium]